MHDAGWAHLDIKPDNICMVQQPNAAHVHSCVIDYGSCQQQGAGILCSLTAVLVPVGESMA